MQGREVEPKMDLGLFHCRLLNSLLQCVYKGLSDESSVVQGSALFALGQFSEHLQVVVLLSFCGTNSEPTTDEEASHSNARL